MTEAGVGEAFSDEEIAALTAFDVTAWTLDTPAPEPAVFEDTSKTKAPSGDNADTFTGTDPLGRAIGPAEDHTKVKRVLDADGDLVTPRRRTRTRKETTND